MRSVLACGLMVAAGVCAVAQGAGQSGKRPMTFADLAAMKRVSDPQISPSGKWVLFSVTDVVLEKNSKTNHLWVVPLGGGGEGPADSSAALRNDKQEKVRSERQEERQVTEGTGESEGRFSPDGKWVMYAASTEDGKAELFVAPWDDAKGKMGKARTATTLETEADGPVWAPDSKHFLFVSEVYPECESKGPMGPARNVEETICNAEKDAAVAASPVKALVFTSLLYRHWTQFQGAKRSHIFYGTLDGGVAGLPTDLTPASVIGDHVVPTFSLGGPMGYAISPDGGEVAYVVNLERVPAESTNNDVFVLKVGAEPGTAKKVSTSPGSDDGPAYSPNGKWLAWRSQKRNGFESDLFGLVVMDRTTGKVKPVDLALHNPPGGKFDNWVDEFVWTADGKAIVFASPLAGAEAVFTVSIDGVSSGGHPTLIQDTLHGEYGSLSIATEEQPLRDGSNLPVSTLIAAKMSVDRPSEIVSVPLGAAGRTAYDIVSDEKILKPSHDHDTYLTHLNDALVSQLSLSPLEPFWFTGAAGTEVEGFVVKPPNFDAAKKYPVKFLMHGGPQTQWGDAWSYRWNPELFAADGYVVVMVNRRGSTGYGQKFVDEVSGDWGGKAFVDLMKGLDYAERTYPFLDKDRECALGASYGGFMADWVLTHTDRFKCIVTHDGMYNPQSAFGTTEELWFNEWEFRPLVAGPSAGATADSSAALRNERKKGEVVGEVEQTKAAHPWDYFDRPASEDPFRKYSPMQYIKNAHTPTLVVHSQKDYRLDVSEGFQLFTALQLLGVPSKMLYFPDEGHWVLKPQNSQLWYETVEDWCDRWTGSGKYAKER
jgi:dipeptidyl aminopeptidase/acylaminoacyl peptidase